MKRKLHNNRIPKKDLAALIRLVAWGLGLGFIGFAVGVVGPILLMEESSLGPLLGILFTGPAGLVLGFIIGNVRYRRWARLEERACTNCGYPVGTSSVCTECGTRVRHQEN